MGNRIAVNGASVRYFAPAYRFLLVFIGGLLVALSGSAQGVPAAPNESWVVGEVLEAVTVDSLTLNIQPQQNLFKIKLRIVTVEAIPGAENGLRGYEGKTIEVLAREPLGKGQARQSACRFSRRRTERPILDLGSVYCHGRKVREMMKRHGLLETCNADDRCFCFLDLSSRKSHWPCRRAAKLKTCASPTAR